MTEQLIEFTPRQKPADIGDHALIEWRNNEGGKWIGPRLAHSSAWVAGKQYRRYDPLRYVADDQLVAECQRREITVEKPLVTQDEREFVVGLLESSTIFSAPQLRTGDYDQIVRKMIDYLESRK